MANDDKFMDYENLKSQLFSKDDPTKDGLSHSTSMDKDEGNHVSVAPLIGVVVEFAMASVMVIPLVTNKSYPIAKKEGPTL